MSVFDDAAEDLHADEDLSVAASFRRPPYAWESVRVILSQPTDEFGNKTAGTLQADILSAAVTDMPQPGDELRFDTATGAIAAGTVFTLHNPRRDAEAVSWRCDLSEGTQ